jgi:hypothetical protein
MPCCGSFRVVHGGDGQPRSKADGLSRLPLRHLDPRRSPAPAGQTRFEGLGKRKYAAERHFNWM